MASDAVTYSQALALAKKGTVTEAQFDYWVQNDTPITAAQTSAMQTALAKIEGSQAWVKNFVNGQTPLDPLQPGSAPSDALGALVPSFTLDISGIAGWFIRALKVICGLGLMAIDVSKLLNVDNKITQLASNLKRIPVPV
jgi:hypothetical protein